MKEYAASQWQRAQRAVASAQKLLDSDGDSAASRAYFAAFHALSALFALRGQSFSKHTALRAALHRELVRTELWPHELGSAYDFLLDVRETGDYGGLTEVTPETARMAVEKAVAILAAVQRSCPELTAKP